MTYYIDQVTILKAATKLYGEKVQISHPVYINLQGEYITPYHCKSFKSKFFYRKSSFDPKDPDLIDIMV